MKHYLEQAPLTSRCNLEKGNGPRTKSLFTITEWLDRCARDHIHCSRSRPSEWGRRFARILDVSHTAVKLVPSTQLPSGVQYMTLSHCWRAAPNVPTLTKATLQSYSQQIFVADLPQTFQDAIDLTRALRVEYLWIDSLCILQDSQEDWSTEALLMGEIYQHSYLNIAASKSEDPYGGLFVNDRHVLAVAPLRVDFADCTQEGIFPTASPEAEVDVAHLALEGTTLILNKPNEARYDLNDCLGNSDGNFDPDGKDFAHAARNINFKDGILYAELEKENGELKRNSIDVRGLDAFSNYRSTAATFRYFGVSGLAVDYHAADRIDLDTRVGNMDGHFDLNGKDFAPSARDLGLDGTLLSGELRTVDGRWIRSSIDLKHLVGELGLSQSSPAALTYYDVENDNITEWHEEITSTMLMRRGWVLQERLLAPRIIHFGSEQMYWECMEMQSFESRPQTEINFSTRPLLLTSFGLTSALRNFKLLNPFSSVILQPLDPRVLNEAYIRSSAEAILSPTSLGQQSCEELRYLCYGDRVWSPTHHLLRLWARIIEAYATTELTFSSDRLLAVAGIADILSRRTGIRYIAGMWEHQLPRQLLWAGLSLVFHRRNMPAELGTRKHHGYWNGSKIHATPSWSWASNPQFTNISFLTLHPIIEASGAMDLIKILSIDLREERKSGQICLKARGRLLPISLSTRYWPDPRSRTDKLVSFHAGTTAKPPRKATFLLPVIFTLWNEDLPQGTPNSLLLEWTGEKGVFRRVGIARLSHTCPLTGVIHNLYDAQIADHHRGNQITFDNALFEVENQLLTNSPYEPQGGPISPQMELYLEAYEDIDFEDFMHTYGQTVAEKFSYAKPLAWLLKFYIRWLLRKFVAYHAMTVPSPLSDQVFEASGPALAKRKLREDLNKMLPTSIRHKISRRSSLKSTSPVESIDAKYYLECSQDAETTQFGHFTFGII